LNILFSTANQEPINEAEYAFNLWSTLVSSSPNIPVDLINFFGTHWPILMKTTEFEDIPPLVYVLRAYMNSGNVKFIQKIGLIIFEQLLNQVLSSR
jgi:hypothetical protein